MLFFFSCCFFTFQTNPHLLNVSWTRKLHPTFHPHRGAWIMTEFSFFWWTAPLTPTCFKLYSHFSVGYIRIQICASLKSTFFKAECEDESKLHSRLSIVIMNNIRISVLKISTAYCTGNYSLALLLISLYPYWSVVNSVSLSCFLL